ncbi:hypothetical protein AX17_006243 [Amanita inopinata Kibby_2008]|nr:hypothetical protein AX17_006243 [Amanita inopinata Kibby_2008]
MNNIHVPAHVVVLLRRLANVVSTLSISSHYFVYKSDNAKRQASPRDESTFLSAAEKPPMFKRTDWSAWDDWNWPRLINFQGILSKDTRLAAGDRPSDHLRTSLTSDKAKELTLPWLSRKWSWSSLFSSLETELQSLVDRPLPPPREQDNQQSRKRRSHPPRKAKNPHPPDVVHQLIQSPVLSDPLRTPRYPIVLWLYGFDSRGPSSFPSMRMHYWANVLKILKGKVGAEVIVTSVPGTGSISSRSECLDRQLKDKARGCRINLLAHSMGGLDCRYLISRIKPTDYIPLSLTTISTPHRGSPFMDWCAENIGLGKLHDNDKALANPSIAEKTPDTNPQSKSESVSSLSLSSLPSSFTTLILSIIDSPAYANLTSTYLNDVFNPSVPNDPSVRYFSVAGRMSSVSVWHPFWLPKMVVDGFEEKERRKLKVAWEERKDDSRIRDPSVPPIWAQEREWGNDGLVTVQSAKWGEFLGTMEECDHWQMRGARGIEFGVDLPNLPALGIGNVEGWGLKDWARFVNLWNKKEKTQDYVKTDKDGSLSSAVAAGLETHMAATYRTSASGTAEERAREREMQRARDDAVVKSSTDKLSTVLDWLIEQVPSTSRLSLQTGVVAGNVMDEEATGEKKKHKPETRSELESKEDLERFYVALSRKMYDEGL